MAEDWEAKEPEDYMLVTDRRFNSWVLGDTPRTVGFCVNSPGAAGYCDHAAIWIADQITNPERVISIAVHECLHGIFPDMSEADVEKYGEQIAGFIVGVFKVKGAGPLPELRTMLTTKNAAELFPGATLVVPPAEDVRDAVDGVGDPVGREPRPRVGAEDEGDDVPAVVEKRDGLADPVEQRGPANSER